MNLSKSPLTYASDDMSEARRRFLRCLEWAYGVDAASRRYDLWRAHIAEYRGDAMNRLLAAYDIRLDIRGAPWPPSRDPGRPLLLIANHPFGVPDGIAVLALGEQLGRPVKILINTDLLRVPEMAPFSLPVDFSETREALKVNAASAREAVERLKHGETIAVFPSGGIATAARPFGRADELPWKTFVAKLVRQSRADVQPLYFPGQNSWLFHAASRLGMFLRLSMIMPEALRHVGRPLEVRCGPVIPFEDLSSIADRSELTEALRGIVLSLAHDHSPPHG